MKEIMPLLEQLATKLGTTVEKIWEVLLRQAPISGMVNIIVCIGLIIVSVGCARFVKRKTTVPAKTKNDPYPKAQWGEEGEAFAWLGVGILLLIVGVTIVVSVSNIMTAFLNPEYWALEKVFSILRK